MESDSDVVAFLTSELAPHWTNRNIISFHHQIKVATTGHLAELKTQAANTIHGHVNYLKFSYHTATKQPTIFETVSPGSYCLHNVRGFALVTTDEGRKIYQYLMDYRASSSKLRIILVHSGGGVLTLNGRVEVELIIMTSSPMFQWSLTAQGSEWVKFFLLYRITDYMCR